jgi:hypothetical protein
VDSVCFTAENNFNSNFTTASSVKCTDNNDDNNTNRDNNTKYIDDDDDSIPVEVEKTINHQRSRSTSIVTLNDALAFLPTPTGGFQVNMYGYFIDLQQIDVHEYDRESSSDINSSNSTSRISTPLPNLESALDKNESEDSIERVIITSNNVINTLDKNESEDSIERVIITSHNVINTLAKNESEDSIERNNVINTLARNESQESTRGVTLSNNDINKNKNKNNARAYKIKHKKSLSYDSYEPYDNNINKNTHKRHISYIPPKIISGN